MKAVVLSAPNCFALDSDEQERTGFHYAYSVYQVEFSRNVLFLGGRSEGGRLSTHGGWHAGATDRAAAET